MTQIPEIIKRKMDRSGYMHILKLLYRKKNDTHKANNKHSTEENTKFLLIGQMRAKNLVCKELVQINFLQKYKRIKEKKKMNKENRQITWENTCYSR